MSSSAGGFRSRSRSGDKQKAPDSAGNRSTHTKKDSHNSPRDKRRARGGDEQKRPVRAKQAKAQRAKVGVHAAGVDKPRLLAFEVLNRVSDDDAYANLVLPKRLREVGLSGRDAAFATEITYGCLRNLGIIDTVVADCSSRELESLATPVLNALRLGAYQLLFTRVDDHAAVDTSVRLVESAGHEKAKGFVNGILRTIGRTPAQEWIKDLRPAGLLAGLAFEHAHPEWVARSFNAALWASTSATEHDESPADLGDLNSAPLHPELASTLAADSQRPLVHLVARPGEISAEELALMTGGEQGNYSPYAVYLESGGNPGALEPVQQSLAAVQDEGSQLIARAVAEVELSGADSGRWLDLCAGPGGKAALLGALARIDGARVDAVEISQHRAKLIRSTVADLPVTVHVADGRDPGLEPGYDRVLVDAPCSGLGALRRRPEARWKKDDADIAELNVLQTELLQSALRLVRPGGVVIYSTCSPDLRETRGIVDAVIGSGAALDSGTVPDSDTALDSGAASDSGAATSSIKNPRVIELPAAAVLPEMPGISSEPAGTPLSAQMWPHRHGTDAMFFAVLQRALD